MNQILRYKRFPEQARWRYFARWGLHFVSRKAKIFPKLRQAHQSPYNKLPSLFGQDSGQDIGLEVEVHRSAKDFDQYPAILT